MRICMRKHNYSWKLKYICRVPYRTNMYSSPAADMQTGLKFLVRLLNYKIFFSSASCCEVANCVVLGNAGILFFISL
jgi:hypothetical protein